jgi:regulatory protein
MPTVTDVTEQRRRKTRVNVFLDGEFWCAMARLCQLELGLTPGTELSEQAKRDAERHIAENDAVGYCVDLLSQRPYTRHKVAEKLHAREYPDDVVRVALERCQDLLLLDDERYARGLAEGRRDAGHGRRRVADKLRQDGVERELIELVLDEVFVVDEESSQAERALLSKFRPPLVRRDRDRAVAFLVRRGFGFGVAQDVVARHAADAEQEAEAGPDVEDAAVMLQRKYPRLNPRDPRELRKAQGFLARRGCSPDIARQALQALRD